MVLALAVVVGRRKLRIGCHRPGPSRVSLQCQQSERSLEYDLAADGRSWSACSFCGLCGGAIVSVNDAIYVTCVRVNTISTVCDGDHVTCCWSESGSLSDCVCGG